MTTLTLPLNEFSATTEPFDGDHAPMQVVGSYSVASTTSDVGVCQVVLLNQGRPREEILPNHVSLEDLEARLKEVPGMADELVEARPWVAQTLYPFQQNLRTLRLSRGLTQSTLAALIGTSQPHLARMERGNGDVMRETMHRLCNALHVDMNTLDSALLASPINRESQ